MRGEVSNDTTIYRMVMEETRWEAVSPGSEWSIPLFHLKNRRTFTLFTKFVWPEGRL
jgi:hypothetical protein